MKEFTPDKYLGHKINRISRSIDRYFDRKRCSKNECIPRSQGMMIGYIMDNQGQNIFQKDIEAEFHLSGATVTNMLKSLEKKGYIVRTPMENDARLKRIELTQKALDHENRVRENIRASCGCPVVLHHPRTGAAASQRPRKMQSSYAVHRNASS